MSSSVARPARRHVLLPPSGRRGGFWAAMLIGCLGVFVVLMLLPRGSAPADSVSGQSETVQLTEEVSLELTPRIQDMGWRAAFPDHPWNLDVQIVITNAGASETFPNDVFVSVLDSPGTDEETKLNERWSASLRTARVRPGESMAFDAGFYASRECGEFLAQIEYFVTPGDRQTRDLPFSVPCS